MLSTPPISEPRTRNPAAALTMEQFDRACEAAWAPLVRYLRASAGPDLDIEDLAARTLEIAWRRRATLTDAGGFTPWLLAIATNVAHNGRRGAVRLGRLRVRIANVREARDTHPSAHAELLRTEPGPATRALATLGRSDREVLVLHAWEELGPADIAVVLAISPAAAAQRLHRARARLIATLESTDDDTEREP